MIVDLHSHYPMHLVADEPGEVLDLVTSQKGPRRLLDGLRGVLVGLASRFANYPSFDSGPRVTIPRLKAGGVRVALSVLYSPFDEMDFGEPYGAAPQPDYFGSVVRQIELVEHAVAGHPGVARIARDPEAVEEALDAGEIALVHAVEGGFHLGATPAEIERNVGRLARRGVVYVTPAHLFWRGVATNANAIPFLPDRLYDLLFPQPDEGLSELGRALVSALVGEGLLVDLTHMSCRSLDDTFALLDELDPGREKPVFASHGAFRFGDEHYNLDTATIERIAARDGVVGLIMATRKLTDGLPLRRPGDLAESVEVLARHVDRIAAITGSHRHTAIGTDLDGFIKPTLAGIDTASDLARLEQALRDRYGDADGELICSANALRLLRAGWRGAR